VRWFWVFLLTPYASPAQTTPLVSGVLLERDAPGSSGEFSLRAADDQVFRFRFDPRTQVEREGAAQDVAHLQSGDKVEVIPDRMPHADLRYAVSIRVTAAWQPLRAAQSGRKRPEPAGDERTFPAATLSFSGVVSLVSAERVVLRTRSGSDQSIALLKQTRYRDDGALVDAAALKPNMRVFVEAGESPFGDVEAYQIVWGRILQPK